MYVYAQGDNDCNRSDDQSRYKFSEGVAIPMFDIVINSILAQRFDQIDPRG